MQAFLDRAQAVHVALLEPDGTVKDCNSALVETLGVSREDIVGSSLARYLTVADGERLGAELHAAERRAGPLLLNFCGADHCPYTMNCWLSVDERGDIVLIAEPPLQEDQRRQRQLMEVGQELASLARERARLAEAETRARLDAEAAAREKERAIATVAHEIRQPLGAMRFAVELLCRDVPADVRGRALSSLGRQLDHLADLLEDLLDAARIREGKIQLQKQRLDLRIVLQEVAEDVGRKLTANGIDFAVDLPETEVWVDADKTRLRQVFSNLLDNALKYTGSGGRVTVGLLREGRSARVVVRDTGRGIAPEALARIFELFAQAREGERGGLGIGLAVASGIAALHGGGIRARSGGLGQGAEFEVCLPLQEASVFSGTA